MLGLITIRVWQFGIYVVGSTLSCYTRNDAIVESWAEALFGGVLLRGNGVP